jgi:NADH-ubiquinone oxidoreductase chain 5
LLIFAGCTKRAQIPFSAWLPAAIAAPTPVSALVHSSTLVTAGVYLIFRYENLLIFLDINLFLVGLGSLTMFMARVRAFFEIDIKKIVALSTLSQLGVMISALGAGFYLLGFFHLLSHAFFKALLFVRAGNLIHSSEGYQDLRVIGGGIEILPLSTSIIVGCSRRLCGIPFISAFYSKEAIIEMLLMYNLSFYFYLVLMLGIMLTVFYSIRFLVLAMSRTGLRNALTLKLDKDYFINSSILILATPAVSAGSLIGQKNSKFLHPSRSTNNC